MATIGQTVKKMSQFSQDIFGKEICFENEVIADLISSIPGVTPAKANRIQQILEAASSATKTESGEPSHERDTKTPAIVGLAVLTVSPPKLRISPLIRPRPRSSQQPLRLRTLSLQLLRIGPRLASRCQITSSCLNHRALTPQNWKRPSRTTPRRIYSRSLISTCFAMSMICLLSTWRVNLTLRPVTQ